MLIIHTIAILRNQSFAAKNFVSSQAKKIAVEYAIEEHHLIVSAGVTHAHGK
jgi:hypothetical protein